MSDPRRIRLLTVEDVNERIRGLSGIHSEFICTKYAGNTNTPSEFFHPACGYTWSTRLGHILYRRTGCARCSGKEPIKTIEEANQRLIDIGSEYICTEYVGRVKGKSTFYHSKCKYVWSTTLNNIANKKSGCARCSGNEPTKTIDITNQRFGRLVALYPTDERIRGSVQWNCLCDCGNYALVSIKSLSGDNTKSCGCLRTESSINNGKASAKDIAGQRFGQLLAIRPTNKRIAGCIVWECQCSCGNDVCISSSSLVDGGIQSCGCAVFARQPKILRYVQELYKDKVDIIVDSEHTTNNLGRKRFDIAIMKKGKPIAFIEYDGEGHYMPIRFGGMSEKKAQRVYESTVKNDRAKDKYCEKHSIPLCRIPYTEYDNYESIVDRFIKQNRLQ